MSGLPKLSIWGHIRQATKNLWGDVKRSLRSVRRGSVDPTNKNQ